MKTIYVRKFASRMARKNKLEWAKCRRGPYHDPTVRPGRNLELIGRAIDGIKYGWPNFLRRLWI